MKKLVQSMAMAMAGACAGSALAAVSAEEAKQLGGAVLTAFGAEKAGNKDGTIPEYKNEVVKAPGGYDKATPGNMVDPWNEKPLYSITAQNMNQYADKLTDGAAGLLKKYPNYRLDVYPTHRAVTFPGYVLDNTVKNATNCKAVDAELKLEGCYGGIPFPIPKSGAQVMWNHLVAYADTVASQTAFDSYVVTAGGAPLLQATNVATQSYPYYDPQRKGTNTAGDVFYRVRVDSSAPARKVGEKYVLIDSLDFLNVGRRAYQYVPGQRRVKLAPDLSYDTPNPFAGGLMTMDESKIFLGALDRYDWKLMGKKEKIIPNNNFRASDYRTCPKEKFLTKNFPNPDCIRWEMHRVWVVEGNLKPTFRHVYKKRVYYFDEDGFYQGMGEHYDAANTLWRVNFGVTSPLFDKPGQASMGIYVMDLMSGAWAVQGLFSSIGQGTVPIPVPNDSFFSPEAMAGEGIR